MGQDERELCVVLSAISLAASPDSRRARAALVERISLQKKGLVARLLRLRVRFAEVVERAVVCSDELGDRVVEKVACEREEERE